MSNFYFYSKPLFQLSPLKPLVCNWELVPHILVCPNVQFSFAPFKHSLTFLIGLLSFACCFVVRLDIKNLWGMIFGVRGI